MKICRGAYRMRVGQRISKLRQGILVHFRPLQGIFGANSLFKESFLFEGRDVYPLPSRCTPDMVTVIPD